MGNNANWIISWILRMTYQYGATVYEKNRYQWWDWGQAIAREQYVKDWLAAIFSMNKEFNLMHGYLYKVTLRRDE